MDIVLIAGLWLKQSAWDPVVAELENAGHRVNALALPGVDDGSAAAVLEDQVSAAVAAVDAFDRPLVVGHSAACSLAWMVADRRPDEIAGVVLIGGFPASDGDTYADFFDAIDGFMAFPGWEPFEGPDSDDIDEETKDRVARDMVPVPQGVSTAKVRLTNEERFDVPVVIVCPEFTIDQAKTWIDGGDVPELTNVKNLTYVDIDSGHWPMVTRPAELAQILGTGPISD